jgi:threonine-phosphate decarboxylase
MIVIPGFAEYRRALQTVDCEVVEYALRERDGWQLTDAILDALTPALDCLFLCTPNNPTGLLPERGLLEAIAQRCRALNISLILDEAFLDFMPDQPGFIPCWRSTRTSGFCARSPNFMPFRGCVSATCSTLTPGSGPTARATNAVVHQCLCRPGRGNYSPGPGVSAGHLAVAAGGGARFYARLKEITGLTVWPGRATTCSCAATDQILTCNTPCCASMC